MKTHILLCLKTKPLCEITNTVYWLQLQRREEWQVVSFHTHLCIHVLVGMSICTCARVTTSNMILVGSALTDLNFFRLTVVTHSGIGKGGVL